MAAMILDRLADDAFDGLLADDAFDGLLADAAAPKSTPKKSGPCGGPPTKGCAKTAKTFVADGKIVGGVTPAARCCGLSSSPRARSSITHVIIHTLQGHYDERLKAWADPKGEQDCCKPHYAVASDGRSAQIVPENLISNHTRGANPFSVGIEHEGFCDDPASYTDALYAMSARLTRDICLRNGIPMSRERILGHDEVVGSSGHYDPGGYWDWEFFMALVNWDGTTASSQPRRIVVDATSPGFSKTGSWSTVNRCTMWRLKEVKGLLPAPKANCSFGQKFCRTLPQPAPAAAHFDMIAPADGTYSLSAWWPEDKGNNPEVQFTVTITSKKPVSPPAVIVPFTLDQRRLRPTRRTSALCETPLWSPPFFPMLLSTGDRVRVSISGASAGTGFIVADAVRLFKA